MGAIKQQGIRNTLVTYVGILIGFFNLIVLQPMLLTSEEIGLTRVLFSFSTLVAVLLPLGVTQITIRFFPLFRSEEKKHNGFFGLMILFPLAGFVLASLFLFFMKDYFISQYQERSPLFTEFYNYVIPLSFILGLISVLTVYASALFRTTFPAFLNDIVVRILVMSVISVYFLKWISLDVFVLCFVCVYAIQLLVLCAYIFKIDRPTLIPDKSHLEKQNVKEILAYGFIIAFASFSALGLKYLDSIMIGKYMALSFVGIYSIAAFIPTVIEAPLSSLERIAATKVAHAVAEGNMHVVKEIYYQSVRYLFLLGGFLFIMININIRSLLSYLPEEYHQGISVVFIISLGSLINMAGGSNGSLILNSKKYVFGSVLLILLAALAFLLNVMLIPRFGMDGAAMSTSISILILGITRYVYTLVRFKMQPYNSTSAKILLIIAICYFLNFAIPMLDNPIADILFRSSIISSVFGTLTFVLKIVPEFHQYIPFLSKK